jgi:hypothetical protein
MALLVDHDGACKDFIMISRSVSKRFRKKLISEAIKDKAEI